MDPRAIFLHPVRAVRRRVGHTARQVADRPTLLGAVAALVFFSGAVISMWALHHTAIEVLQRSVQDSLLNVARIASSNIDPDKHRVLTDPSQDGSPEYEEIAEGLRTVMRYVPEVRYVYTYRNSREGLRFVVDASPRGQMLANGRAEHVSINELYPNPDPAMLAVLREQAATVSMDPYTDDWGTLFSAYAPVRDALGRTECYIGVDIDASNYISRVAAMGSAARAGVLVAAIGSLCIGLSVTVFRRKRMAADRAAAESSARLERIAMNLPGMVYMLHERPDGVARFSYVSRGVERVFGIEAGEVREDAALAFGMIHDEDIEGVRATLAQARAQLGMWKCEFRVHRADGQLRWIDGRAIPQREPDGSVLWHGYLFDSTERKETELALERAKREAEAASRAKSEFVANVSHEIRTPMTAIVGYAELMRDGDSGGGDISREEAADAVARNADHLLAIINDILDMSRVEAGAMTVQRVPTDLRAIASEVLALLRQRAAARGLDLSLTVDPGAPEAILADPMRVRQIIINLVGNSIKFTNSGGVSVRIGMQGERVAIAVQDTGIGMSPEQVSKLFAAFSQVDTSPTRAFGGTGLGLALSRRLAQLMRGDISVSSEPGVGSTFTVLLPAERAATPRTGSHAAPGLAAAAVAPEARPLAGRRILLAEDGPDNARLLIHHLERAGAEVLHAADGRKAVYALMTDRERTHGTHFDLVLMDMQMPDLDGYDATAMLRRDGVTLPIIALTAHATAADRARCIAVGCNDYATKPIGRDALIEVCLRWIERGGADAPAEGAAPAAASPARPPATASKAS
ncbi:MAG: ATP-binding protein [Phycisphaerales bacterium]